MKTAHRQAGLLAHPTSLPGRYGLGDAGPGTERFLRWAAGAGQSAWQMLPLGPWGAGHSPYSGPSAFAGNPWLIAPEELVRSGWLESKELDDAPTFDDESVDFELVLPWRHRRLEWAWERFSAGASRRDRDRRSEYVEAPEQRAWLRDWCRFAAIRERHGGPWTRWPAEVRGREPAALRAVDRELEARIRFHEFVQFAFHDQWRRLRRLAHGLGIELIGDLPFYVAHDSADVWARPELFALDSRCEPLSVGGVPPDYFSETGQLWGTPVYRWEVMEQDGFHWWIERLRMALRHSDRVRLDHFRGYAAFWQVDAGAESAAGGRWEPGPGAELFRRAPELLDGGSLIAEDLGHITDDVEALRRELGLPGMRVLQFGLGGGDSIHVASACTPDCVVYSGTHDNDTLTGWFEDLPSERQATVLAELGVAREGLVRRVVELAYDSAAGLVVLPLQDVFAMPASARMNRPSEPEGNWRFRAPLARFTAEHQDWLRRLSGRSGRLPPGAEVRR